MHDWKDMQAELEALYATGNRWTDAYSAIVDGDVLSFPDETVEKVGEWVQRAYLFAVSVGHPDLAYRINRLCEQSTMDELVVAEINELHIADFGKVEGEPDDDDDFEYIDPIDMRARFQLLVEKLLAEVRLAARLPKGADVMADFWTVDDLAEIEGVKPNRIRQRVSEFKSKHGRYPLWRKSIPGKQRGFVIDKAVYRQQMDTG